MYLYTCGAHLSMRLSKLLAADAAENTLSALMIIVIKSGALIYVQLAEGIGLDLLGLLFGFREVAKEPA